MVHDDDCRMIAGRPEDEVDDPGRVTNVRDDRQRPTIVVDGRVVGTWKRRLVRGGPVFSPDTFAPLAKPNAEAVARAPALRSFPRRLTRLRPFR
jgi:hypothetical protein